MKKSFYFIILSFVSPLCAVQHFQCGLPFTDEMKRFYDENGFIVFDGFLTARQCAMLKQEAQNIVADFDAEKHMSIFAADSDAHNMQKDDYFFDSADKVCCFLEEGAIENGQLVVPKARAINKIGHALHDKNNVFGLVTFCPLIAHYVRALGFCDPVVMQSMFIFKNAAIGGAVMPHQDAIFLYTRPTSVVGFWTALDDATQENACLWVAPGSHKQNVKARFVADENRHLSFVDGSINDCALPDDAFVPLEVAKGTLVIFSGTLIHKSEPNHSNNDRNAYTFHVIEGQAEYANDNWLQRDDAPRLCVD